MLQTTTVEESTLELLKKLQADEYLKEFHLAGGTALALYLGHRKSIDLDLFTPYPFDKEKMGNYLIENYHCNIFLREKNTVKGFIGNVMVDMMTYNYKLLQPVVQENGIRLFSMQDIIAMKLSAIADNGTRIKDFVDIACLSTKFPLVDMLNFYHEKFEENSIRPMKGLLYFEDIDFSEEIVSMKGDFIWKEIVKRLKDMTRHQNKTYLEFPMKKTKPKVSPCQSRSSHSKKPKGSTPRL